MDNDGTTLTLILSKKQMNNDTTFKERCPNIRAEEYLYVKVHDSINLKRLTSILNGKARVIKTNELILIAKALNMHLSDLVK